jgi:hypothetical protein
MTELERIAALSAFTTDDLITEWIRRQDQEVEKLLEQWQADDPLLSAGEPRP